MAFARASASRLAPRASRKQSGVFRSSITSASNGALAPARGCSTRPVSINVRSLSSAARPKKDEAKFEFVKPFKVHGMDAKEGPPNHCVASKSELISYFTDMVYFRRLEIVCDTLYKQRRIRGFCHLYDGQEAVAVGMEAGITKQDSIITAYREHCQQLGRGDTGKAVIAEQLGKDAGSSRGKGGSMHMYLPEKNFYGGNGIVGAQIPVGAGVAFAHKYKGENNICVAMCGDGAANQGQVFEAANMAALWKLPVIFCVEDNDYAMGTSKERHAANPNFYQRGDYVNGLWVDGMDVLAVRTAFQWAKEYVLTKGPIFMEVATYRYHGHSMSDPGISYRTREDVAAVRSQRDCIENVRKRLIDNEWASAEELKEIEKEQRKRVDEDAAFAKEAPQPDLSELYTDIFTHDAGFTRAVNLEDSKDYKPGQ